MFKLFHVVIDVEISLGLKCFMVYRWLINIGSYVEALRCIIAVRLSVRSFGYSNGRHWYGERAAASMCLLNLLVHFTSGGRLSVGRGTRHIRPRYQQAA